MADITRRAMLSAATIVAIPAAPTVAGTATPSIDDFLARASASERAWYHANALAAVMGEMHPELSWRSRIDHEGMFALIVGDERPAYVIRQEA